MVAPGTETKNRAIHIRAEISRGLNRPGLKSVANVCINAQFKPRLILAQVSEIMRDLNVLLSYYALR